MPKNILITLLWLPFLVSSLPNQLTTEYLVGTDGIGYLYQSVVHLTVEERSQGVYGFSFTVDNPSRILTAFIDGVP